MTPAKRLALEAAGMLPAPVPAKVLQQELKSLRGHFRPHLRFPSNAKVGLWISNTLTSYILGQNKQGNQTVAGIYGPQFGSGCYAPTGLKVDHAQNLWVACQANLYNNNGLVQEYTKTGSLKHEFLMSCPAGPSCVYWSAYGFDVATDSSGRVYASVASYIYQYYCGSSICSASGAGFYIWSSPSAAPIFIALPSSVAQADYLDIDGSGDIVFDFFGCVGTNCGDTLGEVTTPLSHSWTFYEVLAPGAYKFGGGVYVSNGGNTLNVTDQTARTISQYHLPLQLYEMPFRVLGPTYHNLLGQGQPVSGGFNAGDKNEAQGDAYGWLDVGKVSSNAQSGVGNPNFIGGIIGAAYTPSDK